MTDTNKDDFMFYYLLLLMIVFTCAVIMIIGVSIVFYNGYWLSVLHGSIFLFFMICFGEAYFRYRIKTSKLKRYKIALQEINTELDKRK